MRQRFGDCVGDIVEHCSDTFETPKPPWPELKRAHAESLSHADASTLIVSIADKLHNARATASDLHEVENPASLWGTFSATREQAIRDYNTLLDAHESGKPDATNTVRRATLLNRRSDARVHMTTF